MDGRELATCFPGRERNFLTVQAISGYREISPTAKLRNEKFIIYIYQVLKLRIQVYFTA
jgi:hypothetical protein